MKRKLVAMTLAAVMGLSVAACGSSGDDKPASISLLAKSSKICYN